jgi:hypothetical protein
LFFREDIIGFRGFSGRGIENYSAVGVKLVKKSRKEEAIEKIGFFIPDLIHIVEIRYGFAL